ncbi:MAG: 3-oxoacyl-ACP synthase [Flavobacteriales bacterium]|nr:MAG: 3-oxoacyl-ACP synthase [Flavobacteriales bacterium]
MALFSIKNIRISGVAACVPKHEESNYDYNWISETERKMLVKTIGIEKRRIASEKTTTADMCYEAAVKLLEELNWNKNDIEALVFVSQSPDYFLPASSVLLQDRLKLPKTTLAFDVNLGCSGYAYGLSVISGLMSSTGLKKGLLLAGDKSTSSLNPKDKSSYPLFGDAGTATAIEYDTYSSKMDFNLQSDGSGHQAIIIPHGGMRNPVTEESYQEEEIEKGIVRHKRNLALDGLEVFNFSLREVAPNIKKLYEYNSTSNDDYDYFLFHQANLLMNESIRKKLKIEPEKVLYTLKNFGNTSSASIPLTMVSEINTQLKTEPLSLLLCGFGVGLSWGSVALKTNKIACPQIIEI